MLEQKVTDEHRLVYAIAKIVFTYYKAGFIINNSASRNTIWGLERKFLRMTKVQIDPMRY